MDAHPLSSYLRVEPSRWESRPWAPPDAPPSFVEAVSLTYKDGTRLRIALMQAGDKRFLQAAAARPDKPLSRGVFTKMLKEVVPGLEWKSLPKISLHAVAFLPE